jgi:hypothetical protein
MPAGVSIHPTASSNSIEDISPKNVAPREVGPKWNSTENASDSFGDATLPSAADVRSFLEFLSACGEMTPSNGASLSETQAHALTPDLSVTDQAGNTGAAAQALTRSPKFVINFDAPGQIRKGLSGSDTADARQTLGLAVSHAELTPDPDEVGRDGKKPNKDCMFALLGLTQNVIPVSERAADNMPTGSAGAGATRQGNSWRLGRAW